jgi:uncharacterized membrane protein YjgN (DUF898 family)
MKTVGLGFLIMIAFMVAMGIIAMMTVGLEGLSAIQEAAKDPESMEEKMGGALLLVIGPAYIGMIVASLFVVAYATARQRTYIFANSSLDENITFRSTLGARSLAWVMVTNLLAIIFSLGLAAPWARVRMVRLVLENTQVNAEHGFDEYVTQKQDEQSALGEQIGDAFDVDVGIGI